MANIIELTKVNKEFTKGVTTQILFDIDLSIIPHSFNAVIGASGSGKTTLLNIMGALDRPTTGQVMVDGHYLESLNAGKLARFRNEQIGFIFQFHYLLPEFNVLDNIMLPGLIYTKCPGKVRQRAEELADLVGLYKLKKRKVHDLAGGQQQRVAIARALINNPKVVLADEPSGNLDTNSANEIFELFKRFNEDFGTTFVIVTHDLRLARKAERIIEIQDGRLKDFSL